MSDTTGKNSAEKTGIGRFFKNSLIYATGDLLTKGARFFMVFYYIAVFSKADIGQWAILQALTIGTVTLAGFGFGFATRRFYVDYGDKGHSVIFSFWLVRLVLGIPLGLSLILVVCWLQSFLPAPLSNWLIAFAISTGFFRGGLNIIESWLNIREEALKYRAFTFFQFITNTIFIIVLVSVFELGLFGAILGELVSVSLWTLISFKMLAAHGSPALKEVDWQKVAAYSWPMIFHGFAMWAVMSADRLILQYCNVPMSDVGIYEIGCTFAGLLLIVMMGYRAAWLPRYFRVAHEPDSGIEYGKYTTIYFFLIFWSAVIGSLFIPEGLEIIRLTTGKDYHESVPIFRIVIWGFAGFAAFEAFNQPLLFLQKTGVLALTSAFGFLLNLSCNLVLIPFFGTTGSAIATVISYGTISAIVLILCNRQCKIHWQTKLNIWLAIVAVAICILVALLPTHYPLPAQWMIPFKISLVALFPTLTLLEFRSQTRWGVGLRFGPSALKGLRG